ncbi:hypothetical protein BU14_0048s0043 [Porphyra umbilicalis]|uniref:Archease domain-containing protein n=1 Tax=Porphyra umbilicalis TaxID=2786 RepID=A0A1X6PIV5_PORUM|nr:hypothetical protein BU14_0048s0043 [Porphyra umbilicalis]|eukprot:OSX80628.1 hypothetical protein BU14_0048s0043 [Porphyra umbilicalis]
MRAGADAASGTVPGGGGYEYLDHTADIQIHAREAGLGAAAAAAAVAMFRIMTDLGDVGEVGGEAD